MCHDVHKFVKNPLSPLFYLYKYMHAVYSNCNTIITFNFTTTSISRRRVPMPLSSLHGFIRSLIEVPSFRQGKVVVLIE